MCGGPGRDWTFISGLAGGCFIQLSYELSYEAIIEAPRIQSPWRFLSSPMICTFLTFLALCESGA